jgi:hypothetical protein
MHGTPPVLDEWIHQFKPESINKQGVRASLRFLWHHRSRRRHGSAKLTTPWRMLYDAWCSEKTITNISGGLLNCRCNHCNAKSLKAI